MKKLLIFGSIIMLALISFGCGMFTGGDKIKADEGSFTIEKDDATELDVQIEMGVGELTVATGTGDWVEGSFDTNMKELEPIVTYKKGTVVIGHKDNQDIRIGKIKNKWEMVLSEDIPIDLSVDTGASSANLDLQQLQLNKLNVETGVGELNLNLSGDWKKGFKANIQAGVGSATIILPSDVGVEVKTDSGIGHIEVSDLISKGNGVYVNEAYENADVIIEIVAEVGVGELVFELDK